MREILFRGKRLDNGEWVNGFVLFNQDKTEAVIAKLTDTESVCENVDPATVGQFTGVCDKNGKEIYEGDVLDVLYNISIERENVCVVFGDIEVETTPGFYFSDNGTTECDHTWDFREFLPDREVIGNIHDNPELLNQ